jgi:hypothetical protein
MPVPAIILLLIFTRCFLNKEGHLDNQYTIEGLHLKPESYLIWAKFLKDKGYL